MRREGVGESDFRDTLAQIDRDEGAHFIYVDLKCFGFFFHFFFF